MLDKIPTKDDMISLVGSELYDVWLKLTSTIEEKYETERLWNTGGKKWIYEYTYRRGGKSLCALYVKENCVGFMMIFGKDERDKFEAMRDELSEKVCKIYDEAETFHDGK